MTTGAAPLAAPVAAPVAQPRAALRRAPVALGTLLVVAGSLGAVITVALVIRAQAWTDLVPVTLPVPWLAAAALALRARPGHPGALLLAGLGAGHLVAFALAEPVSLDRSLTGWPAWGLASVATAAYLGGFASLGAALATHPTGVPATGAERWFVRTAFALAGLAAVAAAVGTAPVELVAQSGRAAVPAPPGLPLVDLSGVPVVVVGPLAVVVGAVLLLRRSRRAAGEERRRLAWGVGAAGLLALLLLATPALDSLSATLQGAVFFSVVSLLPFGLLAGVVRYRLLDVDLFVARTLARGAVAVLVVSAWAGAALLAGAQGRSDVTAGLVVLAALTGVPLVRRLERRVDRWLTAGALRGPELLRRLGDELAGPTPADRAASAADLVRRGFDASWVRLEAGPAVVTAGAPPSGGEPAAEVPLVADGAAVGRLVCGPRHGGWGAAELTELAAAAGQVALALRNAELTRRLEEQVVALTASRRRLVRAELEVRRALERDLHDGVQQSVVAVIAQLGVLSVLLRDDGAGGPRPAEALAAALRSARSASAELRSVVAGVQPPALLDQGLVAAVRSRAAGLPLPVRVVTPDGPGAPDPRWGADAEAAAYYVVSEALTNVAKHAGADSAEVRIGEVAGALEVRVLDDGTGLCGGPTTGTGLAGLRDRVEALGGSFAVRSPGEHAAGTEVTARLPLGTAPGG